MNVPKLRFPGFEGDWVDKKLGDEIDFLPGYAFDSSLMSNEPAKFQLLKMSNVYQNELRLDRSPSYWRSLEENLKKFILIAGDTVLTLTGTVGKTDYGYSVIIRESNKYLLNQRLVRLRERGNKTHSSFVKYLVSTERFLYHFFSNSKGGTGNQSNVSIENLKGMELPLPSLLEQTKIASFLSAVDEKLQALKKKKELLQQYKQGVMQKIFSQEIRFKDDGGKEFGDWDYKTLGEVSERVTRKNQELTSNVLTISAQYGLISQLEFFNKSVSAKDVSGYYLLLKDEFAYNKSYSTGYPMGAIKRLTKYEKGVVSTLYICFKFFNSINLSFIEQYFESGILNKEIEKVAQEGARNHGLLNIGIGDFFSVGLYIPEIKEQTKIADFLSAIDDKITHCQTQLAATEEYKKALLQQMFC